MVIITFKQTQYTFNTNNDTTTTTTNNTNNYCYYYDNDNATNNDNTHDNVNSLSDNLTLMIGIQMVPMIKQ